MNSDGEQQDHIPSNKLKFGRKELKSLNKEERIDYFDKYLEKCGKNKCSDKNCTCLDTIKGELNVRMSVAHYLATFEMKSKYEQDSIILEWYKYSQAARVGQQYVWYCLPYDVIWCFDSDDYDYAAIAEAAKGVNLAHVGA